jgi:superoxide dismutase, Fe-Mn family
MQSPMQPVPLDPPALRGLSPARNPGGGGTTLAPAWTLALQASFGTVERWRDEFVALGQALGGGSGWVLLVFQPREGRLVNIACADPTPTLAGGVPILAVEVYEHADSGTAAAACVEACMANIDWAAVYARYQEAVHAASATLAATQDEVQGTLLLDVRRAGVYEQASQLIDGASWRDPAQVAQWAGELPAAPVVVYCIYGHEVGRATALRLRAAGINARFLQGGFDAWKTAGRPLMAKPQPEPVP